MMRVRGRAPQDGGTGALAPSRISPLIERMLDLQAHPGEAPSVAAAVRLGLEKVAAARLHFVAVDGAIMEDQVTIARIPAPLGGEAARADWLTARFADAGLHDATTDDAGNLVVRIPGEIDGGPVAVLSHLDTVFTSRSPADIVRSGDRWIGPGINDNARGLAAMLAIGAVLSRGNIRLRRPVLLVATTGEEGAGDLRGAKHFFGTHPGVVAAIALDGAGDDRIVNAALGSRRLRIAFHGPGGHSWSAYGTANAVHAAALCAATLARLALPAGPRATLSVGRIGGGESVNAIPAHAWLEVDARSADASTLSAVERDVRRAVSATVDEENRHRTAGTPPLSATVERFGDRPSGLTPARHPLVAAAIDITRQFGCEPRLAVASTDANIPMSLGIPAIAIGAGGAGGDAHTDQEWYENVEGPRGITRALAIIVTAAAL